MVILAGIIRVFRAMRRGEYDEDELEEQLDEARVLLPVLRPLDEGVNKQWQIYPVGFLFGLGFDTATEIALLATTALLAAAASPGTRSCACRSCSRPG